ncbi:Succinylglutamate desuccinylase / Aspartoacylase family protein [Pseudovibrio axinellae]|uniref:Succinylglutamate desuccinylase / Aspartoacylase family protein n=1 Tax=Pseudovibrio axinellae TaxID=989403 RepID=A0A165U1P7_9HYPH|nr:succinylglutamate desuccinylase/aspartoacylase family protein [Pseudovibrio axinellae]KZL09446.1 Succinylglutamate desuccinylase / Aspartoacylase family protein [Pseudovibrio axinellae]SEQ64654.1 hypothetical protein SAMN05421798_103329 [Pseudovibrio axinellae]
MLKVNLDSLDLNSLPTGQSSGYFYIDTIDEYFLPFFLLRGEKDGPTALVTAGLHPTEYTSIEAAYDLILNQPAVIRGTLAILPLINWKGFWQRSITYNPADNKNFNRVFPGDLKGSESQVIAQYISEKFTRHANVHLDLHSGNMVERLLPFCIFHKDNPKSSELADVFGLPYKLGTNLNGVTTTAATSYDCAGLIAEGGECGHVDRDHVEALSLGVRRVLSFLGMTSSVVEQQHYECPHEVELRSEIAKTDVLWYPKARTGQTLQKNETVGYTKEFFDKEAQPVLSMSNGVLLYMMDSILVKQGEPLYSLGEFPKI